MGQYFRAVLLNDPGTGVPPAECYHSCDLMIGAKLMEHTWVGNEYVNAVIHRMREIERVTGRAPEVVWSGDYSCGETILGETAYYAAWDRHLEVHSPICRAVPEAVTLVNHETKQFVRVPKASDVWTVHPLPILTAAGNGQGSGDYRGERMDLVGYWAASRISVRPYGEEAPAGFEEIPSDAFRETGGDER